MTVTPYYPRDPDAPGADTPLDPDVQGSAYVEYTSDDALNSIRNRCDEFSFCGDLKQGLSLDDNSTYIYMLPYFKYCPEATMCGKNVGIKTPENETAVWENSIITDPTSIAVLNAFNGSTVTYREMYGVPAEYQGSENVVQGTSLSSTSVSNLQTDYVYEYLNALNLTYSPLAFAFGTYNNKTRCDSGEDDCGEQLLDVTTMMGMAPLAFNAYLPINDVTEIEKTAEALDILAELIEAAEHKPDVISWSWGFDYPAVVQSFDDVEPYIADLEKGLERLAMMNITIVVGPGDNGASGRRGDSPCVSKEDGGLFQTWPGMSPWVTSVGGTDVMVTKKNGKPQEVVMTGTMAGTTTAGGFSAKEYGYTTPSWQKKAVDNYLNITGPDVFKAFPTKETASSFNPNGRAYPDIAAYGSGQMLVGPDGRATGPVAGTSLSAPIVASLFTLANQKLTQEGYEKIGYANPMLYWMGEDCPEAFTDVLYGNNTGSEDTDVCNFGYPATPGWDAVSGWGTINFEPFVQCAMKYQETVKGVKPKAVDSTDSSASESSPVSQEASLAVMVSWHSIVFAMLAFAFF